MRTHLTGAALIALLAACEQGAVETDAEAPQNEQEEVTAAPDASTLPEALKAGEITPAAITQQYLSRIDEIDDSGPFINAVLRINDEAVSQAEQLAETYGEAENKPLLYGLPILIKDNIETADMPTTAGSLALLENDTKRDAPAIAKLREAGAVILGKTNLSEWANFRSSQSVSGYSAVGGLSRNPHDVTRNTCGSSSGSGAAVAAGLAWGALGTETNGSVICPSASNGIVGFKPTVGLVSRRHVVPISASQDTIGPMTTSVRDAAMILTAMAGTDEGDEATLDADQYATDFVAALEGANLEGVRLGVLRGAQSDDPREQAVFNEALRRAEEAGAILVDIEDHEVSLNGGEAYLVLQAEFKDGLNAYLADAAPAVTTRTLADVIAFNEAEERQLALFGQDILTGSEETGGTQGQDYQEAVANVQRATREEGIDRLLADYEVDFLVAPSFAPAFAIDLVRGDKIGGSAGAGWIAAIAGYPHLTVPMGDVRGLPVGFSIMGARWSDAEVLAVGQAMEDILPERLVPTFREGPEEDEGIAGLLRPVL
ncbi:amidase [Parvularcula maris]|uniref:Amidase n=1 Tax=Parvularcula maris TaxID=2965077 RepID=A0A9X2RK67_9PROT|nr:amidase [Parvularcula maris]MCQ8185463.1 amidase [Parvularcula maris]